MFKPQPVILRDGHSNFFTPLRVLMALIVLLGHATMVNTGDPSNEPNIFFHYNASSLAVNAFFIASGYLVTKSMMYRKTVSSFAAARILRIMPALLAHVLIVAFIIGAVVTTLPLSEYLLDKHVLAQPLKVLSFYDTAMVLPGVFENNPEQLSSATLWTLRYEMMAYMATALLFVIGFLKRADVIAAQFVACALLYIVGMRTGILHDMPATVSGLMRFMLPYSLGAAVFAYQDKIKLYWPAIPALFGVTALLSGLPEMEIAINISLAYALFWLAYMRAPKLAGLQKMTDISYGIYIYHWVVLQLHLLFAPDISLPILILNTTMISCALATLSWHLIEKPALGLKGRLANILSLKRPNAPVAAE